MQPARSEFLDSEIAMVLAARRILEEKPEYKPLLTERIEAMQGRKWSAARALGGKLSR